MKRLNRRQIRKLIRETMDPELGSYDLGWEDSVAGIRPQDPDEDYMRGYNESQVDAGLPTMQAPSDSGKGQKLDPELLKGATISTPEERAEMADYIARLKAKKIKEAHPDYGEYDADADAWYEERHQADQDYRVHEVPDEVYTRVQNIQDPSRQDHLFDLVDAYEAGDPDANMDMLLKNLEDAELNETKARLKKIIKESLLVEADMLPIMVNPYEDLDTMNRVANYALTNDIKGALADEMVNYEGLDMDLDGMHGWVQYVGEDDGHFSEDAVVPDNWDLDKVYEFMKDLESAWMKQQGESSDSAHSAAPDVKEREVIGNGLSYDYVLPEDISGITFQVRRRGGTPSNINLEDEDTVGNISAQRAGDYGLTLDDIIDVLRDGGAKERKKQKPVKHTPPMYD